MHMDFDISGNILSGKRKSIDTFKTGFAMPLTKANNWHAERYFGNI